jgi:hypothetical protein
MVLQTMVCGLLLVGWCTAEGALLLHRYSFTTDASDSVGSAHGTVVDAGVPTAVFAGGQLNLSGNTGESSNNITQDAYVNLPNGMISDVASEGTSGAFTIELWATVSTTRTWQRYVDFGTSNFGEDVSHSGSGSGYIYITPNSGVFSNGLASAVHPPTGDRNVGQTGPLPNNIQFHIVSTYDQNDTSEGSNGTFKLYRDDALIGAAELPLGLDLNTFTNNNNWLGRSQWPDPIFDGLFNELRLYDHALSAAEVAASFASGPDVLPDVMPEVVPEPSSLALLALAGGMLAAIRRRKCR